MTTTLGGSGAGGATTTTTTTATTNTTSTGVRTSPSHLTRNFPSLHGPRNLRKDNFGRTDLTFLVIFPLLFAIFNVFYWVSLYWWRWSDYSPIKQSTKGVG